MELGPKNLNRDGFLGPNSIGSVYGPSGKGVALSAPFQGFSNFRGLND